MPDADNMNQESKESEAGVERLIAGDGLVSPSLKRGTRVATSSFRGVCWHRKSKRWQSAINSSGRHVYLGSFDTEEEAARMFDKVAIRVRGPKAKLNFPYADYVGPDGQLVTDTKLEQLVSEARKALLEKQRWLEMHEDNHDAGKRRRLCTEAGQGLEVQCAANSHDRTPAALPNVGLDLGLSRESVHGSSDALNGASGLSIYDRVGLNLGRSTVPTAATARDLLVMTKPSGQMASKPLASHISSGGSGGVALGPAALSILCGNAFNFCGIGSGNPQHPLFQQQRQPEPSQLLLQVAPGGSGPGRVDEDRLQMEAPTQDGYMCPREAGSGVAFKGVVAAAALGMQNATQKASAVAAAPAMNFCLGFDRGPTVKQDHGWATHARSPMGIPETPCLQLADCSTAMPARTAPPAPAAPAKVIAAAVDATRGSVSRTEPLLGSGHIGGDLNLGSLITRFLGGIQSHLPADTEIESLIPCADGSLLGYTFVRVPEGSSRATAAAVTEAQAARQGDGCSCDDGGGGITKEQDADDRIKVVMEGGVTESLAPFSQRNKEGKRGSGGSAAPECNARGGSGDGGTAAGIFFRGTYRNLGTYSSTSDALQACKACMTVLLEFKERLAEEAAAAAGVASARCERCVCSTRFAAPGPIPPAPRPPSPSSPAKTLDRVLRAEAELRHALSSGAEALAAHPQPPQRARQLQQQQVLPDPPQRKVVREEWQGLRDMIVQLQTLVQHLGLPQRGILQPQYMDEEDQRRCSGLFPGQQQQQQQGRPRAAPIQTRADREGHLSANDMSYDRGDEMCVSSDGSQDDGNRPRQSRLRPGQGQKLPYAPQPPDNSTAIMQRNVEQQQSDTEAGEEKQQQRRRRRRLRPLDVRQRGETRDPPQEQHSAAQALEMQHITQLITSLSQLNHVQPRPQMEGIPQVEAPRQEQQVLRQGWAQLHQIVDMHRAGQQQQQQQQQQQMGRQPVTHQLERRHRTPQSTLPQITTDVMQLHTLLQHVQTRASDQTRGHSAAEAGKVGELLQALLGGGGCTAGWFGGKPRCDAAKEEDVSRSAEDGVGGQCARNPSGSCDSTDDAVPSTTLRHRLVKSPLELRAVPGAGSGGCSSVRAVAEEGGCRTSFNQGVGECDEHGGEDGDVDGCGLGSSMAQRQEGEGLVCRQVERATSVPIARVAAAASNEVTMPCRKSDVAQAALDGDEYGRRHVSNLMLCQQYDRKYENLRYLR
ncbi:hypothetical protein Vafri_19137 [Volvox africanus]|uniref:AP2/ERF domain-containing protein n=1 Tax=Volvox africanus TaxID=51714 RepID=A0A8J4BPI6_9CHLO|nr:hypothetical protein Vafri_19137 [Volvox africanus]